MGDDSRCHAATATGTVELAGGAGAGAIAPLA
jgi:hypothetical protein